MKEFDTADVAEEAHKRTKEECKDKGITLDKPFIEGNEQHYTGEAQTIFNRHFDEVEEEFEQEDCSHNFQDWIDKTWTDKTCGDIRENKYNLDKMHEEYLTKIVNRVVEWLEGEATDEEIAKLVMTELIDYDYKK